MTNERAKLYSTAKATVSCAEFKAGDYVNVEYYHTDAKGTVHFKITRSQHGPLANPVVYPEHHLTNFCL